MSGGDDRDASEHSLPRTKEVAPFDLAETDRLLTTTRSVRRRLDLTRDVPIEVVRECLTLALQAPTASAHEAWRWIVVTDEAVRVRLGELYRRASEDYLRLWHKREPDLDESSNAFRSASVLTDHLSHVPVLVAACFQREAWHARSPHRQLVESTVYGSIFPAIWTFQLACRSRGLGTCFVASHLRYSEQSAEILGLPEDVGQAGLVAVAYSIGGDFRPAPRRPLSDVLYHDRWGQSD